MSDQNVNNNVDPNNANGNVTPTPPANPAPPAPSVDIEDLLRKVRQDEKNKLYPEIEKLKAQLDEKTTKLNEAILKIHQLEETEQGFNTKVAELTKLTEELKVEGINNMEKDKTLQELQAKVSQLEGLLASKDTEIEKVKTEYELRDYRREKLKDVDESVSDLVVGSTKEEIDASIEKAKATYEKIASKFKSADPAPAPAPAPAVPPVGNTLPPVNMTNVNDVFKNVKVEDIYSMTPKQYAEWRKANPQLVGK